MTDSTTSRLGTDQDVLDPSREQDVLDPSREQDRSTPPLLDGLDTATDAKPDTADTAGSPGTSDAVGSAGAVGSADAIDSVDAGDGIEPEAVAVQVREREPEQDPAAEDENGGRHRGSLPDGADATASSGESGGVGEPGGLDESKESEAEDGDVEAGPAKATKGSRAKQLEREGEVAADFLETLLDIADLDGDIEVDIDGDRAAVAIVDSEEGRVPRRLVGAQGKVLEALQELTRLAVQTATGERSRLMLDVAGHRAERRTTLGELAQQAIAEVKESGRPKVLDDMTAFERKVIHDEVAAAGLESESEGVEPHRHIVILTT